MKFVVFFGMLVLGLAVVGCDFYPKETKRGKPLRLLKDSPEKTSVDEKAKAAILKKREEQQKGQNVAGIEMDCTVQDTQRPIRLLNRSFKGFALMASCDGSEDGKTSTKRIYVLEDEFEDLYSIGKGTRITVTQEMQAGERYFRYTGITSGAVQQRMLPGGVDDFNEVMLGMPGGEGSEYTCLASDRMKKMSIGKDRMLRTHVGDDVHDTYWYVECAGRTWPAEGVLVFYSSSEEVVATQAQPLLCYRNYRILRNRILSYGSGCLVNNNVRHFGKVWTVP